MKDLKTNRGPARKTLFKTAGMWYAMHRFQISRWTSCHQLMHTSASAGRCLRRCRRKCSRCSGRSRICFPLGCMARIFCSLTIRCSGASAASATGCTNKAARPSSAPQGRSWPRWSFRRRKRRISMVFCAILRWTAPATATLPSRSRAAAWPTRRSRSNLTAACWYRLDWTRSARA